MNSESGSLRLRPATMEDLSLLRHWDKQPHVIAATGNGDWEWETQLPLSPDWREWLIAELEGRPIGFIQIIDPAEEEGHYWGEVPTGLRALDIWLGEARDLGHGYGTRIMHQVLARCFASREVEAVLIDPLASNWAAQRFYERLGFRLLERRRFDGDDCFIYRLSRHQWQASSHQEADMSRQLYFEIQADDPERARTFYQAVFGWTFAHVEGLPQAYWRLDADGLLGGMLQRPAATPPAECGTNAFTCSFEVDDIHASAERIIRLGGRVALPVFAVPGRCWQGYFIDPEGNTLGLFQVDPEAA